MGLSSPKVRRWYLALRMYRRSTGRLIRALRTDQAGNSTFPESSLSPHGVPASSDRESVSWESGAGDCDSGLPGDAQFAHPVKQSGPRDTQPGSCAVAPSHHPPDLPQNVQDMIAFGVR
jgi:hypothetical protein